MWDFMNDMAQGVRNRMMPRRRNGVSTMTAMILGASVGIAAWETMRRSRNQQGLGLNAGAAKAAQEVIDSLDQ